MKQRAIVWAFKDQRDGHAVIVKEYGFQRYIKRRVEFLEKQANVLYVTEGYVGAHFWDCFFRRAIYS